MRDFKNMKRQRGRNRSGGGNGGGGGKPQQNANRAFESNGPDNLKIRGHAQHVFEKYQQLARDATSSGDRVLAENFLQHAEHYFRLIRTLQPNRPYTDIVSREGFVSGYDIDFEDEGGEGGEEAEASSDGGEAQSTEDRGDYRDQPSRDGRWDNRNGDGRDQNRDFNRQDQNRSDQNRADQNRSDNRQGADRQGNDRYANNRNNQNGNRNRDDRPFNRDRNDGRWETRNGGEGARFDNGQSGQNGQSDRGEAQTGEVRSERPDRDRYDQNRADQPRSDQPRSEQQRDRYERRDRSFEPRTERNRDPMPVVEPQPTPLTAEAPASKAAEPAEKPARTRVLRSRDGDESHTPAFLQSASAPAPSVAAEDVPVKRPRGRPRKTAETAPEIEEV